MTSFNQYLHQKMKPRRCKLCAQWFYNKNSWRIHCDHCFPFAVDNGFRPPSDEVDKLQNELELVRNDYNKLNKLLVDWIVNKPTLQHSMPTEMLDKLIRLAHPDKHGNSLSANEATAWLLAQRPIRGQKSK